MSRRRSQHARTYSSVLASVDTSANLGVDVETLARQCSSVHTIDSDDLDQYEVLQRLGAGGFGEACRVRNKIDNREYVMKIIHTTTDEEMTATMKEMIAMRACRSPYTVRFEKLFKQERDFYLLMEFCSEGDLFGRIMSSVTGQPLTEDQILRWFTQIAIGLKAIHDRGLIHRDLKPSNVFFSRWDVAKLGDFGLATQGAKKKKRAAGQLSVGSSTASGILNKSSQTKSGGAKLATTGNSMPNTPAAAESREVVGGIAGTPGFIAPEALQGKPYNAKCDIWALGCILYEMLTARSVFVDLYKGSMEMTQPVPICDLTAPTSYALGPKSRAARLYSPSLRNLLLALLDPNPDTRPTIDQVLSRPELALAVAAANKERALLEQVAEFESRVGYDGNARAQRLIEARFLPKHGVLRSAARVVGSAYAFGSDCIIYLRNSLYWLWTAVSNPDDLPYVRRKLEADSELTDPQTRAVIAALTLVLFPLMLAVSGLFAGVATSLVFKYWRLFLSVTVCPPLLLFLIKVAERATRDAIVDELQPADSADPSSSTAPNGSTTSLPEELANLLSPNSTLALSTSSIASPSVIAKNYPFLPWSHLTQFAFFYCTVIITFELLNLHGGPGERRVLHLGFGVVALLAGAVAYWLALTYRSGNGDATAKLGTSVNNGNKAQAFASPDKVIKEPKFTSPRSPPTIQLFKSDDAGRRNRLNAGTRGPNLLTPPLEDSEPESESDMPALTTDAHDTATTVDHDLSDKHTSLPGQLDLSVSIDQDVPSTTSALKPSASSLQANLLEEELYRRRQQASSSMLRECALLCLSAVNVALFFMLNTHYAITVVKGGDRVTAANAIETAKNSSSFLTLRTLPLISTCAIISYAIGAMFKRVPWLERTLTGILRAGVNVVGSVLSLVSPQTGIATTISDTNTTASPKRPTNDALSKTSVLTTSVNLFTSSAHKFINAASGPLVTCIVLKVLMMLVMMLRLVSRTYTISSQDAALANAPSLQGIEVRQDLRVSLFSPFFLVPDMIFIALATLAHSLKLAPSIPASLRYGLALGIVIILVLPFCFSFVTVLVHY